MGLDLTQQDLSDELCELLDELPAIRMLPAGHIRRSQWLERKHEIITRLGACGPDKAPLRAVRAEDDPLLPFPVDR